jgi:hypothetical protein
LELEDIMRQLDKLPPDQRIRVQSQIQEATKSSLWIPNPGPQHTAYLSPADVLLYGGSAGSGKSGLILGLGFTKHTETLIMRRKYTDLEGLQRDAMRLFGSVAHLSGGARPKIKTNDHRLIEFGACQHPGDEESWQGIPHDLLAFDEVTHFLEVQFRFLQTWNRTARPNQRSRVVAASNPPTSADGDWVIGYWRPWLDPTHSNPAKPGELRWFVTTPDGKDMEVPDYTPVQFPGEHHPTHPKSRTFIPGKLSDNPYLTRDSSYKATLDALPEPLRSAMRDGNFMLSREDDAYQVIPTQWVREAVARWENNKPVGLPMCCIAADPAQGGRDFTTLAMRYDGWYDNIVAIEGSKTPLGTDIAALLLKHRRDGAAIVIDLGGGYGSSALDHLRGNEIPVFGYKGAEGSSKKTVCGKIGFPTRRSEVWWKFREALDPSQPGGSPIALPPDAQLLADLTAPTFEFGTSGIKVEPKEKVKQRLGRSTDKGDAVVMAWMAGEKNLKPRHPGSVRPRKGNPAKVLMGYTQRRR